MKVALGTVQLGMPYGISNHLGQPSLDEAAEIIEVARLRGIDTIDTAVSYGDSERRLGKIGVNGFKIVSKLPAVPNVTANIRDWVLRTVEESLSRLQQQKLHGLLLHRPSQLLEDIGPELFDSMVLLRDQGLVNKIGLSIYNPAELDLLATRFDIDIVQAPMNLLDRRIFDSGWADSLNNAGIELHGRSIFLQGLLLMAPEKRPAYFHRWHGLWNRLDNWIASSGYTVLELLLGYVLNNQYVSKVVVGVENSSQLVSILDAAEKKVIEADILINDIDESLVNPALWHSLQEVPR